MQNNIRKLRGQSGMSQVELAKMMGVNRATIINLESSQSDVVISAKNAKKLCEIFKCDLIDVYGMSIFRIPLKEEEKQKVIEMLKKE